MQNPLSLFNFFILNFFIKLLLLFLLLELIKRILFSIHSFSEIFFVNTSLFIFLFFFFFCNLIYLIYESVLSWNQIDTKKIVSIYLYVCISSLRILTVELWNRKKRREKK